MKSSIKKIGALLFKRSFIAAFVVFVLCVSGLWYWQLQSSEYFKHAYTAYATLSNIHTNNAFIPGAAANPLRHELNQTLARSLAKETSVKDRLTLAQKGIDFIAQLNKEIDAIGESAPAVQKAIEDMQLAAGGPGNAYHRSSMFELVTMAREQLVIIEDIRGFSYRTNFETSEIFKHIIADKGALTDMYITELNNRLPVVEEQFSNRENLYSRLQTSIYRMQQKFDILNGTS